MAAEFGASFRAAVLAAFEEDLGTTVIDHFDLIAGTSTGGIITLALGLGFRPQEIVEFYLNEGALIFRNSLGLASIRRLFRNKFGDAILSAVLQKYFGDRRFGDSSKRLVIPSYNVGEDDVYIFRTAHHARLRRDSRFRHGRSPGRPRPRRHTSQSAGTSTSSGSSTAESGPTIQV